MSTPLPSTNPWLPFHRHLIWADERILAALGTGPNLPEAVRLMSHAVAAVRVWVARLEGRDAAGLPIWPERSLDELEREAVEAHGELGAYLNTLRDEGRSIVYHNSSGRAFENRVSDVLTHLFLHGAHHRGQVARVLREGGGTPVNTDYIAFVREGGG